jgi:hypothetical protein
VIFVNQNLNGGGGKLVFINEISAILDFFLLR